MKIEYWKPIPGYEGLYEVSSLGRVKSLLHTVSCKNKYNIFLKTYPSKILSPGKSSGYFHVTLFKDGIRKQFKVHRLVAMAFIPNPNNFSQINHRNEITTDNRVENLEWCDASYNSNFGSRIDRIKKKQEKAVYQYSVDGTLIKIWRSASEIQRSTGMYQSFITDTCNGKHKLSYGYIWSYTPLYFFNKMKFSRIRA